ncbi:UNVERIFIED_CONTAM: Protein O-mannosyltransferase 2 [Siphonaria sp. JEL0065]|nr:Protein O-mannosyltransferase 2 [Siphonaria sp. JEL0065]
MSKPETELRRRPVSEKENKGEKKEEIKEQINSEVDPAGKAKARKTKAAKDPLVFYVGVALTMAAFFTRLYRLGFADFVVWDEAHFGKFASFYIKREFYHDVHPPLGKMLLGLSGLFVGYDGRYAFESGAKYPASLNYTGMRAFCSLIGALMVPLGFYTGLQLKLSLLGATFLALMVMLDVALLSISRFILLDSLLLFFTALSAYCLVVFRNYQKTEPLSPRWHIWMALLGVSLGCTLSVKWVGLFVIALVGINSIEDLWDMLGDIKMPVRTYAYHWFVRITFLIVVPFTVYALSFLAHFTILNHSGEGDAQMSSLFQANLVGNNFHENPISIAFGSKISIKNNARGGGLLHSHVQTYPPGASGSEQQQVTCYHHKDVNNNWIVMTPPEVSMPQRKEIRYLREGDEFRLMHEQTGKILHSHALVAPVTKSQWEVSGYGSATLLDPNDIWQLEIVKKDERPQKEGEPREVRSMTTRFAIRHVKLGCLLHSGDGVNYPEWGFKQAEVYCDKSNDTTNTGNLWNVEQHWNDLLPPGGSAAYPKSFWRDFVDLNIGMWTSNNALTPDPDKEPDALTSKPLQWPFMDVGLRMCGWGDHEIKFFLLGNPVVWLGSTLSLFAFGLVCFVYAVRSQRRCGDWKNSAELGDFIFAGQVGVLGWFLHYFPFFIMGRVILHHYFPALYFAIILFAFITDHVAKRLGKLLHTIILLGLSAAVIGVFLYFSDFVWGMEGPASKWKDRKWRSGWKIYD